MSSYSKSEFNHYIILEHQNLIKHLKVFSKKTRPVQMNDDKDELFGPQYILNIEDFLKEHMKTLETNIVNPITSNEDIKFSIYQEYRILELILNINRATNYKISQRKQPPNTNSQLIISNNIIRNSPDLTSYVFLLEWLHKIFNLRLGIQQNPYFKKHTMINSFNNLKKSKFKNFHFNMFENEEFSQKFDKEEWKNYKMLIQLSSDLIRCGRLAEAEEQMKYHNINFFSACVFGGLPYHDFNLDGQGYENFDELMLPTFMKTLELKENLDLLKKVNLNENKKVETIGNPNWQFWLRNMWDNCSNDKIEDPQLKYIFSCISGNPNKIIDVCNNDYYEALYAQINCLLNKKFYDNFLKEKFVNFSIDFYDDIYAKEEDCENGSSLISREFPNIKCLEIEEILNSAKNNDIYSKPKDLLVLSAFCLLYQDSKSIIIDYAKKLKDENFNELVKELMEHFHDQIENLHTSIAISTDIYKIYNGTTLIDDVLKDDLYNKLTKSKDDINKISQIKALFLSKNVDMSTCYKYIISLLIKFLNSNKFQETIFVFNEMDLKNFLTYNRIFNGTQLEKFHEKEIINYIECTSNLLEDESICYQISFYFLLKIMNCIIKCYTLYKGIVNEEKSSSKLNQSQKNSFIQSCLEYSYFIKLYNLREDLKTLLKCIFDESYIIEINSIISRWLFQIISWTYELGEISKKNQLMEYSNPLPLVLEYICYNEAKVYSELLEQLNIDFFRYEISLFNIMEIDVQKMVMTIIYKLICNNKENSSFFLDNELLEEINEDFEKEFPIFYKEN